MRGGTGRSKRRRNHNKDILSEKNIFAMKGKPLLNVSIMYILFYTSYTKNTLNEVPQDANLY